MLVSAAVCPAAALVIPEVAQGAAGEMDQCRTACRQAVEDMLAAHPDLVVAVGAGLRTIGHPSGSVGTLAPIGVDLQAMLGAPDAPEPPRPPALPRSLTIAAWLLGRGGCSVATVGQEVATDESPTACASLGAEVAGGAAQRVGLLVMADGTARRGPRAPGYTDERAAGLDEVWVRALAEPEPSALAALDPGLCSDLMMEGRAPLQVLAGAVGSTPVTAHLGYADDPYGVQYAVASWQTAT